MNSKREPAHLEPRPHREWLAELHRRFPTSDPSLVAAALQLMNLGRGIGNGCAPGFREVGLSEARFTVVMMIYRLDWELRVATPSELAKQAKIGRAAMTQLLDSLVDGQWIERRTHPDDRRKLAISLSAQGRRRLEGMLPEHYARLGKIMNELTDTELGTLRGLLAKVAVGLDSLAGESHE